MSAELSVRRPSSVNTASSAPAPRPRPSAAACPVAVPAAADDHTHLAVTALGNRPQRRSASDGVRRVGVVDDGQERLSRTSIRCIRPGTPGTEATPATAVSRSTPVTTKATMAAIALATLNRRAAHCGGLMPEAVRADEGELEALGAGTTSSARQCAAAPVDEKVQCGTSASVRHRCAIRRPYSSSALTTPRSGVRRGEQLRLGLEVVLEVGVEVEVILASGW